MDQESILIKPIDILTASENMFGYIKKRNIHFVSENL